MAECNFLRLRIVTGAKAQIAAQNRSKSVVEQSPSALQMGKEVRNRKKAARKPRFLFHNEELCDHATKNGLSGWSARYFVHVKQDAVSESGFSERLARCSEFRAPGLSLFADFNRGSSFYGGGVIKQR